MIAAVFPGQGSQKPGMGQALYESSREAKATFEAASQATGIDLAKLCFETDEDTLRQTQNAQLALFVCGLAAYRAAEAKGFKAQGFAGHSVGEYAALAAAGILSAEEGAKLVQRRGDLMSRSGNLRPGGMAAVLGLEREALESICHRASNDAEVVVVANDNCPGQLVISGDKGAVERAGALATESAAKRVLPLNVSGAFHSPLMVEAAEAMGQALRQATFQNAENPVYSNVEAIGIKDGQRFASLLEQQLQSPVRWTESVQQMRADGYDTFVEFGVGEVLCGLIRRIDKESTTLAFNDGNTDALPL